MSILPLCLDNILKSQLRVFFLWLLHYYEPCGPFSVPADIACGIFCLREGIMRQNDKRKIRKWIFFPGLWVEALELTGRILAETISLGECSMSEQGLEPRTRWGPFKSGIRDLMGSKEHWNTDVSTGGGTYFVHLLHPANKRRKSRSSDRFYFLGLKNHCGRWLQPGN